jgi:hypothetical protein
MVDAQETYIQVDVRCRYGDELYRPAYRIYIDGDLLAERSFIWRDESTFVRENIVVFIGPGKHYLKIDKVGDARNYLDFTNVTVNGKLSDFEFYI